MKNDVECMYVLRTVNKPFMWISSIMLYHHDKQLFISVNMTDEKCDREHFLYKDQVRALLKLRKTSFRTELEKRNAVQFKIMKVRNKQ